MVYFIYHSILINFIKAVMAVFFYGGFFCFIYTRFS